MSKPEGTPHDAERNPDSPADEAPAPEEAPAADEAPADEEAPASEEAPAADYQAAAEELVTADYQSRIRDFDDVEASHPVASFRASP